VEILQITALVQKGESMLYPKKEIVKRYEKIPF